MENKFLVVPRKSYGTTSVVSARIPEEILKKLDVLGQKTNRTRNELILLALEFALDRLEVQEHPQ